MSRTLSRHDQTKDCPFCAEKIRVAAIACRFCNRDLPADDGGKVVVLLVDDGASEEPRITGPRTIRRTWQLVLIATTALLLVVAFLGHGEWRAATEARQAALAAKTVRATVPAMVEGLLSYRHDHFDEDLAVAGKALTSEFRDKYQRTVEPIRADAVEQRRTQTAEVLAVSVISQAPDRVELLLYVDSTSKAGDSDDSRIIQAVLRAVMVRADGGSWRLDDLTVPTS